jgi:CheY-like chemotaxis protein
MRILYVEDNEVNQALVERVLRAKQCTVVFREEGEGALEALASDPEINLILLDIELAGSMNGLDVIRAMRARNDYRPVVAITAYAMMGDRERFLEAGCDQYLPKPLVITDLLNLLDEYEAKFAGKAVEKPAEKVAPSAAVQPASTEAAPVETATAETAPAAPAPTTPAPTTPAPAASTPAASTPAETPAESQTAAASSEGETPAPAPAASPDAEKPASAATPVLMPAVKPAGNATSSKTTDASTGSTGPTRTESNAEPAAEVANQSPSKDTNQ